MIPGVPDLPPLILSGLTVAYAIYKQIPFLSQPWRVVVFTEDSRYEYNSIRAGAFLPGAVVIELRKRFLCGGVEVGRVNPNDEDFDEKLIELKSKADDMRRRMKIFE